MSIIGDIPAIITPAKLMEMLGFKSPAGLSKLTIPRRRLFKGSSKYIYLASDVLDYFRSQRDESEIYLDDIFD